MLDVNPTTPLRELQCRIVSSLASVAHIIIVLDSQYRAGMEALLYLLLEVTPFFLGLQGAC